MFIQFCSRQFELFVLTKQLILLPYASKIESGNQITLSFLDAGKQPEECCLFLLDFFGHFSGFLLHKEEEVDK